MHHKALSAVLCILALGFFSSGLLLSTTSSLYEPFIINLRYPIAKAVKGTLILILLLSLLNVLKPGTSPITTLFLKQVGWIILISSTLLVVVGVAMPCLVQEPIERDGLSRTLYKSLLCPSFSIKSFIALGIQAFFGCMIILCAYAKGKRTQATMVDH